MKDKLFSYNYEDTFIHNLSGMTKLLALLILSFAVMLSYDIRVILLIGVICLYAMKLSNIRWNQIRFVMYYIMGFAVINMILTFLFSPLEGVSIYGTQHDIIHFFGNYTLTWEQVFYQVTKISKYAAVVPLGLIFILTTNPSEFAASLNKIGVPYKISYSVALTLRYLPDVMRDFTQISLASQARGLDLSKKAKTMERIKNAMGILVPLVFSTLDRIESISNAMDLRGFGKLKQRSWYAERPLKQSDRWTIALIVVLFLVSIGMTLWINGSRFYNPFL
ncbi:MAG: energy-coupling factor transporter transmembrane component T family protein [Erysipelotrichaceae bacterium]